MAARKVRADELVVQQGLADSRSKAKALIVAGDVRSGDRLIQKPAEMLDADLPLELRAKLPFVSRGGLKLDHALTEFGIDVNGVVAADLGASTGGFTDVLLQRGAARVYAIDVGYGQLDYRLRTDPRVVVMERVNARYLETLPEPVGFVCVDVSFISLEHMLPVAGRLLSPGGDLVTLVKPQFEAGKDAVGRGGVVRDDRVRRDVVTRVIEMATSNNLLIHGLVRSPITGPAGNVEYLAWFRKGAAGLNSESLVETVFAAKDSKQNA
jgi:23S rRNA (cytidine1920-2'-O)/16S rRNA (cytidine1409-2'-O)-methyltransferase